MFISLLALFIRDTALFISVSFALRYDLLECFALLVMDSDPTRGSRHDFPSGRPGRTLLFSCLICSKSKLKGETNRIKEILLDNGYPEEFVLKQISKKITQFSNPKRFGPDKCPVYLRLNYTGKASLTLEKNVRTAFENCYGSVAVRTVFISRQMLPTSRKDVLPALQKSSVIYRIQVPL